MLILNIPHSGLELKCLPKLDSLTLSRLYKDCIDCADLFVDKLFTYKNAHKIVFPISRMCIDVERYIEEEKEVMAKYNRGMIYTVLNDGHTEYRSNSIPTELLMDYLHYHENLDNLAKWQNYSGNKPFIIDCHSFNQQPFPFDLCQDSKDRNIDICFGYNEDNPLPQELKNILENWAKECSYSFSYNTPYSGTITCPSCKDSLMIEINKRVYLYKDNFTPKIDIYKVSNNITRLLELIDKWWSLYCKGTRAKKEKLENLPQKF